MENEDTPFCNFGIMHIEEWYYDDLKETSDERKSILHACQKLHVMWLYNLLLSIGAKTLT